MGTNSKVRTCCLWIGLFFMLLDHLNHFSVGLGVRFSSYASVGMCTGGCSLAMTVDGSLHPHFKLKQDFFKKHFYFKKYFSNSMPLYRVRWQIRWDWIGIMTTMLVMLCHLPKINFKKETEKKKPRTETWHAIPHSLCAWNPTFNAHPQINRSRLFSNWLTAIAREKAWVG